MSFRKNLMCVGAGLLLTACGGGGGNDDGLGSSSYDNEIVVRVVFEDGPAFDNVAAVNGDYSELDVTFDLGIDSEINEDDLRVYYRKEFVGASYQETIKLQRFDGVDFEDIPDAVQASFNGNTFEWVIDTAEFEDFMNMSSVITDETLIRVYARKEGAAFAMAQDFIPNLAELSPDFWDPFPFAHMDSSGYVTDVANPSGDNEAVDLRSVRVLFY